MEFRDPICTVSHLLTAIWAVIAALVLYRIAAPIRSHRLAVVGYGVSMVGLYTLSALFHGVPFTLENEPGIYRFFQKLDHADFDSCSESWGPLRYAHNLRPSRAPTCTKSSSKSLC